MLLVVSQQIAALANFLFCQRSITLFELSDRKIVYILIHTFLSD